MGGMRRTGGMSRSCTKIACMLSDTHIQLCTLTVSAGVGTGITICLNRAGLGASLLYGIGVGVGGGRCGESRVVRLLLRRGWP